MRVEKNRVDLRERERENRVVRRFILGDFGSFLSQFLGVSLRIWGIGFLVDSRFVFFFFSFGIL